MSHYLVTGGAGFIGSHLVDSLINDRHTVTVLDNLSHGHLNNLNPAARFVDGDIRDKDILFELMENIDGCFHLAAIVSVKQSHSNWLDSHSINLSATVNLLEAIRYQQRLIPMVYASSAAVYGNPHYLPINEEHNCHPLSAYGADKLGCEHHCFVAHRVHNIPTIGLRLFNVYGPRQSPDSPYAGVISRFMDNAVKNKQLIIFGDGNQTRDFIYVADVVKFFKQAIILKNKQGQVFNACTGRHTSIEQLAKRIKFTTESKSTIKYYPPQPGDITHSCGNTSLARKELFVDAQYYLADGLELLYRSFNHQR